MQIYFVTLPYFHRCMKGKESESAHREKENIVSWVVLPRWSAAENYLVLEIVQQVSKFS